MGNFKEVLRLALITAASSGSQNFLGARWIQGSLKISPRKLRRPWALRLLRSSPHYFYRTPSNASLSTHDFLESEYRRNLESRKLLIDGLISSYLHPEFVCLDYGCGPGFLAIAVASKVAQVIACDISPGVLACAATINFAPNVEYRQITTDGKIPAQDEAVDFVYSFAVIQHLTDDVLRRSLDEFRRVMKPGATGVCHVVLDGAKGWKSEAEWRDDKTMRGRMKWGIALHCFARSTSSLDEMISRSGLKLLQISPIGELGVNLAGDDIVTQHLCVFKR